MTTVAARRDGGTAKFVPWMTSAGRATLSALRKVPNCHAANATRVGMGLPRKGTRGSISRRARNALRVTAYALSSMPGRSMSASSNPRVAAPTPLG